MSFDHQAFSRNQKLALNAYLFDQKSRQLSDENWKSELSNFELNSLKSDRQKLAFWINVYNGFTNHQIVSNQLKESVWEKSDFFTDRSLEIDGLFFSLDDIEHGLLRRNGKRRNDKPVQFKKDDPRGQFMVADFDHRIHFALNCGSVSCPPLAYYSEDNIDQELDLAEESFASQEFLVDHEKRIITCSQIFVWYRQDFTDAYLNSKSLKDYDIKEVEYKWKLR